jgi:hypothetical protein
MVQMYGALWRRRYSAWEQMTPLERVQISVEGIRCHLSGPRCRGEVGVLDQGDRYIIVLDPFGRRGVLRTGDPDTGRPDVIHPEPVDNPSGLGIAGMSAGMPSIQPSWANGSRWNGTIRPGAESTYATPTDRANGSSTRSTRAAEFLRLRCAN